MPLRPLCLPSIEIQSVFTCSNDGHLVHRINQRRPNVLKNILHLHVSLDRSPSKWVSRTIPTIAAHENVIITSTASDAFISIWENFRVAIETPFIGNENGWRRRALHSNRFMCNTCSVEQLGERQHEMQRPLSHSENSNSRVDIVPFHSNTPRWLITISCSVSFRCVN